MLFDMRFLFLAVLAVTLTFQQGQGRRVVKSSLPEIPGEVEDSSNSEAESLDINAAGHNLLRLRRELAGSMLTSAEAVQLPSVGEQGRRRKRFWSSSESSSSEEQVVVDNSGYAAALDALLEYHEANQRDGRREVDMPDMRKETEESMLFFTVTTVMSVSRVRLRVPATLQRVSRVTASVLPDGAVDMSCNVRLGDFQTWGKYNVKVAGVGPSGDFETTIRGRVVHATVRYRDLPPAVDGEAGPLCSLEATDLSLVDKGSNDVPAVLSQWASQVEDVPTTLQVMQGLLNERLSQYPCNTTFVEMVRRGYAGPA